MRQDKQKNLQVGELGEKLVQKWLIDQGWKIVASRWRCSWGEIDIIAQKDQAELVAFIEVKTRSDFNWDHQGVDSITFKKQEKLSQSAELFLAKNPQFADYNLRFDVALVSYQKSSYSELTENCFKLESYLESAFEIAED
jgi:putative endonuclease